MDDVLFFLPSSEKLVNFLSNISPHPPTPTPFFKKLLMNRLHKDGIGHL